MKIMVFHEIRDFHDRARLSHGCRAVQSAEKYFFVKNHFFLGNKNTPRIISDIVAGVGRVRERPNQRKS